MVHSDRKQPSPQKTQCDGYLFYVTYTHLLLLNDELGSGYGRHFCWRRSKPCNNKNRSIIATIRRLLPDTAASVASPVCLPPKLLIYCYYWLALAGSSWASWVSITDRLTTTACSSRSISSVWALRLRLRKVRRTPAVVLATKIIIQPQTMSRRVHRVSWEMCKRVFPKA